MAHTDAAGVRARQWIVRGLVLAGLLLASAPSRAQPAPERRPERHPGAERGEPSRAGELHADDGVAAVFVGDEPGVSGMLAATLLGVFFIPALFVGVEKLATRKGGEKPSPTPTTAPTPEPVAPSPAPSVTS